LLDELLRTLAVNCAKLCIYVQSDHDFRANKKVATELITTIVSSQNVAEPCVFTLATYLIGILFEHETNNYYHLAFFSLFQALSILEPGFADWLTGLQITDEIINYTRERSSRRSAMWGLIHQLTGIVKEFAIGGKIAISEGWTEYIRDVWEPAEAVMAASYGGEHPPPRSDSESEDDGIGYRCRFVNSCDLLAALVGDAGLGSSSSSGSGSNSSGSEEEEESVGEESDESEEDADN
jgi:hypothetical protein